VRTVGINCSSPSESGQWGMRWLISLVGATI
jgi:hypothetical protein